MTQPAISDRFRVGQLAHEVGKTVRTIHFYEELGLLLPAGSPAALPLFDSTDLQAQAAVDWMLG